MLSDDYPYFCILSLTIIVNDSAHADSTAGGYEVKVHSIQNLQASYKQLGHRFVYFIIKNRNIGACTSYNRRPSSAGNVTSKEVELKSSSPVDEIISKHACQSEMRLRPFLEHSLACIQ